MAIEIVDGTVASATGLPGHPVYRGYSCVKGRRHADMYGHPDRLQRSLRRSGDAFEQVVLGDAIDDIAARISGIVDRHGARAIAMYTGTMFALDHPANRMLARAFMRAIGSPMYFDSGTIDQPGKLIARGFHGSWMAPGFGVDEPDAALLVGNNPLVSHQGQTGNPGDFFKGLQRRSGSLIVVDPRRTETAKRATIHLQARPGHDVAIVAAILNIILSDDSYDAAFVEEHTVGFGELRSVIAAFTPATVAERAGVDEAAIVEAARLYAASRRGFAMAGTGPNMSGYGTLLEYLLLCLQTVCGHWQRRGSRVRNGVSLLPASTPRAQARGPVPAYGINEPMRVRGLGGSLAGLPTAALSDEILMEGRGRVRGLLSLGGSPVNAWPDQLKLLMRSASSICSSTRTFN